MLGVVKFSLWLKGSVVTRGMKDRGHGGPVAWVLYVGSLVVHVTMQEKNTPFLWTKRNLRKHVAPISSMHVRYIYPHERLIFMVNVGKYTIHGLFGVIKSASCFNMTPKNMHPRVVINCIKQEISGQHLPVCRNFGHLPIRYAPCIEYLPMYTFGLNFMVNVVKYSIHGASGNLNGAFFSL